jgi:hypothetical protein
VGPRGKAPGRGSGGFAPQKLMKFLSLKEQLCMYCFYSFVMLFTILHPPKLLHIEHDLPAAIHSLTKVSDSESRSQAFKTVCTDTVSICQRVDLRVCRQSIDVKT